jgi:hypothetical protein
MFVFLLDFYLGYLTGKMVLLENIFEMGISEDYGCFTALLGHQCLFCLF